MRLDQNTISSSRLLFSRIEEIPARIIFYIKKGVLRSLGSLKSSFLRLVKKLARCIGSFFCTTLLRIKKPVYLLTFLFCLIAAWNLITSDTFQEWWEHTHPYSFFTLAKSSSLYLIIFSLAISPFVLLHLFALKIRTSLALSNAMLIKNKSLNELNVKERLRSELLTDVSHDILKPVANIRAYLETVLNDQGSLASPTCEKYLQVALKNTSSLDKLVSDFLELSKLENGAASLKKESFSICDLISDIYQRLKLLAEKSDVQLEIIADDDIPLVHGDASKIERVLVNLIDNAIKYTKPNGIVRIVILPHKRGVLVRVEDTGIGISEDEIQMIAKPLFRASNINQTNCPGHGLGLAITKKILSIHSSELHISSRLGQGSIFAFTLLNKP